VAAVVQGQTLLVVAEPVGLGLEQTYLFLLALVIQLLLALGVLVVPLLEAQAKLMAEILFSTQLQQMAVDVEALL
jgi:hypothetical protein